MPDERTLNDTSNWVADMDSLADDEVTQYSFMRIDVTTGFIGEAPE